MDLEILNLMQRIPEPELMDEVGQVLAYAQADFAASDAAMVERLAQLCGEDPGTTLVDLGCGPGNISLLLADRWPAAKVLGLDGAPRMLAVALERLAGASPGYASSTTSLSWPNSFWGRDRRMALPVLVEWPGGKR